jgi:hypothetical protein
MRIRRGDKSHLFLAHEEELWLWKYLYVKISYNTSIKWKRGKPARVGISNWTRLHGKNKRTLITSKKQLKTSACISWPKWKNVCVCFKMNESGYMFCGQKLWPSIWYKLFLLIFYWLREHSKVDLAESKEVLLLIISHTKTSEMLSLEMLWLWSNISTKPLP